MGAHVLSAGHGYTYLTRQVAAHDATDVPPGGLGAYYSERGESPGRWMGSGLAGVGHRGRRPGQRGADDRAVRRGPASERRRRSTQQLRADGAGDDDIADGDRARHAVRAEPRQRTSTTARSRSSLPSGTVANGQPACAEVPDYMKARIRTAVGGALFAREHGREAADARELSSFIATQSRVGSRASPGST